MTLTEAIEHCSAVTEKCNNKQCALDHRQLMEWLIELKYYRKRYGEIEKLHPSIILTKSNLNKEKIRIDEITRIEEVESVYNGNHCHSRIWFNNGDFHYYIEKPIEINNKIKIKNN